MTIKNEPVAYQQRVAQVAPMEYSLTGSGSSNRHAIKKTNTRDSIWKTNAQTISAQRLKEQRERLIRYLVSALEHDEPISTGGPRTNVEPRQKPQLVLLGNQQTLILGVVLSDHGATASDFIGLGQ